MTFKIPIALFAGLLLGWSGAFAGKASESTTPSLDEDAAELQRQMQKLRDQSEKYGLELSDVSIRINTPAGDEPKPVPRCTVAMDRNVEGLVKPARVEATAATCLDAWHEIRQLDEA